MMGAVCVQQPPAPDPRYATDKHACTHIMCTHAHAHTHCVHASNDARTHITLLRLPFTCPFSERVYNVVITQSKIKLLGYLVIFVVALVDADRHDVVLVPNVTVGNNTVVQSVIRTLKPGDSILMLSLAYGKSIKCI